MKINYKLVILATIISTLIIGLGSGMWLEGFIYSLLLTTFVSFFNSKEKGD